MNTYAVSESFECSPLEIELLQYQVPCKAGTPEMEEVIARLLWVSKEEGEWVGVSYKKLTDQIFEDIKKYRECRKKEAFLKEINQKNRLTFGLYGRIKKVEVDLPRWDELPFSLLFSKGVRPFEKGVIELLDKKWIELRKVGKETVLFPKKELIEHIRIAQGV
jgi:hypothetical protein